MKRDEWCNTTATCRCSCTGRRKCVSFRMLTSQLIVQGSVTQGQIQKPFGVSLTTIKRYTKVYRERGVVGFSSQRSGVKTRGWMPKRWHKPVGCSRTASRLHGWRNSPVNSPAHYARRSTPGDCHPLKKSLNGPIEQSGPAWAARCICSRSCRWGSAAFLDPSLTGESKRFRVR